MQTKKAIKAKDGSFVVVPINRRRACRYMCIECMAYENVDTCTGKMLNGSICPLKEFQKMDDRQNAAKRNRAISLHCRECIGDTRAMTGCVSPYCPLYPFRGSIVDRSVLFDLDIPDDEVLEKTRVEEVRLCGNTLKRSHGSVL